MTDGDGNYGYRGADDSFVPFSGTIDLTTLQTAYIKGSGSKNATIEIGKHYLAIIDSYNTSYSAYTFNGVTLDSVSAEWDGTYSTVVRERFALMTATSTTLSITGPTDNAACVVGIVES